MNFDNITVILCTCDPNTKFFEFFTFKDGKKSSKYLKELLKKIVRYYYAWVTYSEYYRYIIKIHVSPVDISDFYSCLKPTK